MWSRSKSGSQAYVPLIFDPGEAHQFDWSHEYAVVAGATTRVKAAHMRLCPSRLFLVQNFPREGQEMVFEAHERSRILTPRPSIVTEPRDSTSTAAIARSGKARSDDRAASLPRRRRLRHDDNRYREIPYRLATPVTVSLDAKLSLATRIFSSTLQRRRLPGGFEPFANKEGHPISMAQ